MATNPLHIPRTRTLSPLWWQIVWAAISWAVVYGLWRLTCWMVGAG